MNLAISDVRLLSRALFAHYKDGTDELLDRYSQDALQRVWAASNLSWKLTRLLHVFPGEPSIDARLRVCDYEQLLESEDLQRALARDYAGASLA